MARATRSRAAANDHFGDQSPMQSDYVAGEGEEGFSGIPLVRKVYNDLLALHQRKANEEAVCGLGQNRTLIEETTKASVLDNSTERQSELQEVTPIPQIKYAIQMPSVEPLPTSIYWVYSSINFPSKDSKYLGNIPYTGEDDERANQFNKELFSMYKGKYHTEHLHDDWSIVHPLVLPDFFRVLMKLEEVYGSEIFSDGQKRRVPSNEDLSSFYDTVKATDEKVYARRDPSRKVLQAAMGVMTEETSTTELKKKYFRLAKRRTPEAYLVADASNNIDEPMSVAAGQKKQMDSYATMFCMQCSIFGCVIHKCANHHEDIQIYQTNAKIFREKNHRKVLILCSYDDCCTKEDNNLAQSGPQTTRKRVKMITDGWKPNDRTMFNCMYGSYQSYCLVASMMKNKTCKEVKEYHRLLLSSLMDLDTKPDNATPARDVDELDNPDESRNICSSTTVSSGSTDSDAKNRDTETDDASDLCTFVPCVHAEELCDESCSCVRKHIYCEASCACFKDCKNRFRGCKCKTTCNTKTCPCFGAGRKCDPNVCRNCGSHELNVNDMTCKNMSIQRGLQKSIKVAESEIHGQGAFTNTDIKKGEFLIEYTGELITHDEAEKRGHIYDHLKHTFLFDINDEFTLDATYIGNESRFLNSSNKPNCRVARMTVKGESKIAIFASKDVAAHEELFINYENVLKIHQTLKGTKRKRNENETD